MRVHKLSFLVLLGFAASIPLEDSVSFGVGRISKVLGLVALGVWVLAVASTGMVRRPVPAMWLASGLVGWSLLSYFWSDVPEETLTKVGTLAQLLTVVWLVWDQTPNQRALNAVLRAFVLGAFIAAVLTLVAAATGRATEGSRFASANAGPNNTGALLVVAVCMAVYLRRIDYDARYRVLYALFVPVAIVGVILTASRTAAISLATGLLIIVVGTRRFTLRRVVGLAAVGVVAIGLAVSFVPQRSLDRLATTPTEISAGDLNGRTYYWKLSVQLFAQRPVQGIGAGAFPDANLRLGGRGIVAHNAFLSVLVELGAVGIALFLGMLGLAVAGIASQPRDRRGMWMAMGATWFVGANSLTWEVRKITWFLLAVALAQGRINSRAKVSSAAPSEEAPRARVGSHRSSCDVSRSEQQVEDLALSGDAAASHQNRDDPHSPVDRNGLVLSGLEAARVGLKANPTGTDTEA